MSRAPTASTPLAGGPAARALGLAISAAALGAVIWWATRQQAPSFPTAAGELAALAGAIGAYGLATVLRAERWRSLLRSDGARPGRGDCYALTAVGFMGNNALPARGGDALRVVLMAPRAASSMRSVLGTLLAERLLDVVTLVGVFALLAYGLMRGVDAPSAAALGTGAAVALATAIGGALALRAARHSERGRGAIEFLRPIATASLRLGSRHGAAMLAVTVAVWLSEAVMVLLVARSIGLDLSPLEALYVLGVAALFLLVPAGPAHAGTLDAGAAFGIRAVGGSGAEAVSFVIMVRFVLMVPITLVGLAMLLLRYGWRPGRGPASSEQATIAIKGSNGAR